MPDIDVAEPVSRRVHDVAGDNQGQPHRAAALLAPRIATDCGGFDLSDPYEIEKATARQHASRRLPGAAPRVLDPHRAGSRFRGPGHASAAASAREDPLRASVARWRRRRAFIGAANTGEQADDRKEPSGSGR